MRSFILFFVLLMSVSFVSGEERVENFNEVSDLVMSMDLNTSILVEEESASAELEYMKANLEFVPISTGSQQVVSFRTFSNPPGSIEQGLTSVEYTWTGGLPSQVTYGFSSRVKVSTYLSPVDRKISFPATNLPSEVVEYTRPTEFIDINERIERQALEIIGSEDDYAEVVFRIADWVTTNVEYDLNTLTAKAVQKSSWVLENRKGVCDELTNLFISLLRSVGIPAKFVSGMVYTNVDYDWGPHGWAEVYFPGYGWVPYDVTFREYGWLDASHIKLNDNSDSGAPSAEYAWRARDVNIEVNGLELDADLVSAGKRVESVFEIQVRPLQGEVGFGSVVPVEVSVRSKLPYYTAPKIVITKAPELREENVRVVSLGPYEEKSAYWLVEVPSDLKEEYVYTAQLEVKTMFGDTASSVLKYAADFPLISEEYARTLVKALNLESAPQEVLRVDVVCAPEQDVYYTGENVLITCTLKSQEDMSVDVCFMTSCERAILQEGVEESASLSVVATNGGRFPLLVKSQGKVKVVYVGVNAIRVPELVVKDASPTEVEYGDEVTLRFTLFSDSKVKGLVLDFGFSVLEENEFEGEKVIEVMTPARNLIEGLEFSAEYVDEKGEKHAQYVAVPVRVNNVPWYGQFLHWVSTVLRSLG